MADKRDYSKVKIIHVMADGTVRDSVKGYVTDASQLPYVARRLLTEMLTACEAKPSISTIETVPTA